MDRRTFIKKSCTACLSFTALSTLVSSCVTTKYISGRLGKDGLTISKDEFNVKQKGGTAYSSFIIVRNDALLFPICVYRFNDNEYTALWMQCTHQGNELQASGDVLMMAEGTRVPYRPYPPGDPRLTPIDAAYTQVLTIKFVRAAQGQISGTIASYWDPDRSCQASATFLGSAQPRAIDGTFTSTCEDGVRQLHGKWRVTRERPSPR